MTLRLKPVVESKPMDVTIRVVDMNVVLKDAELYATARRLTINRYSGMNTALDAFEVGSYNRSINAIAIFAYSPALGRDIGWALYSYESDHFGYVPNDDTVCFQVYVERGLRRRGVGSKLLNKATELAGERALKVYHDDAPVFFNQHKAVGKKLERMFL